MVMHAVNWRRYEEGGRWTQVVDDHYQQLLIMFVFSHLFQNQQCDHASNRCKSEL
jgi:hypothetical protein